MGADMLLVGLPAAEMNQDRQRQLEEIINDLPADVLEVDELQHLADAMDIDELQHLDEDFGGPETIRMALRHHAERFAKANVSREVARLHLPHMPYAMFFTGGPSWGDDPTLMFETFAALAEVEPLFVQLEQWAIEDAGNRPPTHQEQSALAVLEEFADDVRAAFGTGDGQTIDEKRLDWPDLAATYRRALKVLDAGGQGDPREEVNP